MAAAIRSVAWGRVTCAVSNDQETSMGLKTLMAAAGMAVALAGGSAASATTYLGNESFDGAAVDLSITTDGTLGVLEQHDITDYDITITDANGSAELTPGVNSYVEFFGKYDGDSPNSNAGGDFTATTSSLSFNFAGGVGGVLFINQHNPRAAFCLQNDGCFDFSGLAIFAGSHIDTSYPFGEGRLFGLGLAG